LATDQRYDTLIKAGKREEAEMRKEMILANLRSQWRIRNNTSQTESITKFY